MKKKFWKILGISFISLIVVTAVYAFAIGSIDATWGLIDTNGATGQTWATGPSASSTAYDSPTSTTTDTTDLKNFQDTVTFDWNQVRYGSTDGDFSKKSGFGFLGRASVGEAPGQNVPFLVGQFCHFNNPISPPGNAFENVPLNIELKGIGCEPPYVLDGPENLSFQYIFNLDETTNEPTGCDSGNYGIGECLCRYRALWWNTYRNRCDYGRPGDHNWPSNGGTYCYADGDPYPQGGTVGQPGDLNYEGCADKVSITKSTISQSFDCVHPTEQITKTYYLSLLGFIKPAGDCPESPTGLDFSNNLVYTAEKTNNCYCLYAAVTDSQITPVTLKDLAATGVEDGILISWETVTETNNLGFNIMRAESVDGEQVQINPELIMSDLAPGDMFGSAYEYLDKTAVEGVTYYYWLVDVPLDSGDLPGIHGPVSAVR